MPDYFLIHDAAHFEGTLRPAMAASWKQRSFESCRAFCSGLLTRVEAFAETYRLGAAESLVHLVANGLPFARDFWRALVGELLLYTATEIPEFPTCLDALCSLVSSGQRVAVQQAHHGSRDLTLGAVVYRPDACGYNDAADVRRLAYDLAGLDPAVWTSATLTSFDESEREEELAFARDWFPSLCEMYQRAAAENRVVIRESV
jgi:hypothetical protein